ncbi:IS110 family transposase [Azospirillum sp. YIM B02556]|uniref:IS110 family transposase n=1 Tax=Azospirillum endophyticum TaxID=2800326 RepID=A0ABS1F6M5_9PROT|nr:IS110 family transposase [Azospirillum endophyticum]MBK1839066.1 IS110 family transposase [Azospirillum endophyticum]
MAQDAVFVGIDCGKEVLDVVVVPGGETLRVANSAAGHEALIAGLKGRPVALVGIEASGGYERAVRDALEAAGIAVAVLDPARVRHLAKAKGQRAKTDPIDAALIADFTARFQPSATPSNRQRERLADLLGLRRLLVDKRADLKKAVARLPADVAALAEPALEALGTAVEAAEREITRRAQEDAALAKKAKALSSAPGVGALTALTLAVLVPELGQLSGGQAAALLGVAPYPDDSGQRHGARRIAGGREDARRALYMAALTAATGRRKGGVLASFYDHLIGRGKPPKVALTACMRKLIVRLNAMLAHGGTWSEQTD